MVESGRGHTAVLLPEVLAALNIRASGTYLDATFGRGGHAEAILEKLTLDGRMLCLDRDPVAIAEAKARLGTDSRVTLFLAPFSALEACADAVEPRLKLDGILFDLGVSSPQLDDSERGFSFMQDGPLDMRMSRAGTSAADVVNGASAHELAGLIARVAPSRERHKHPATRVFQALRIHVNRELAELESALEAAHARLAPAGRLAVISFHSLEDRMVKRFMRRHAQADPMYAGLPDIPPHARPTLRLVGKSMEPDSSEIAANPRARSARLRVAERLPEGIAA